MRILHGCGYEQLEVFIKQLEPLPNLDLLDAFLHYYLLQEDWLQDRIDLFPHILNNHGLSHKQCIF